MGFRRFYARLSQGLATRYLGGGESLTHVSHRASDVYESGSTSGYVSDLLPLQDAFFIQIVEFPRGIVPNLELAITPLVVQLPKFFSRVERGRIEGFLALKYPHLGLYGPIEVSLFVIGFHHVPESEIDVELVGFHRIQRIRDRWIVGRHRTNPDRLNPDLFMEELRKFRGMLDGNFDILNDGFLPVLKSLGNPLCHG